VRVPWSTLQYKSRKKPQERMEELARERAAATIDLGLVEEGIEIGKKMMAEMIATYSAPPTTGTKPAVAPAPEASGRSGYLNEVSPLNAASTSGEPH